MITAASTAPLPTTTEGWNLVGQIEDVGLPLEATGVNPGPVGYAVKIVAAYVLGVTPKRVKSQEFGQGFRAGYFELNCQIQALEVAFTFCEFFL